MKKINGWVLPDDDNEFKRHLKPRKVTYYQQNVLDSAYCYVKNYHTVIDIGANIGLHSVRFARAFQNVIAFEPVKDNFRCLKQNLKTKKKIQRQSVTLVRQNQYILSRTGIVAFVEKLPLLFSLYRCRFRYLADHFRT